MGPLFQDKSVCDGQLNVWRCVVAMAHADGIVDRREYDLIRRYINNFRFSDEQRQILEHDFMFPPDVDSLLPHIHETHHKRQLVQFSERVALVDGYLDYREVALLKKYSLTLHPCMIEN